MAAPEPTEITVESSVLPGVVAPSLFVELGYMGGLGYPGGDPLIDAIRRTVLRLWVLAGDSHATPGADKILPFAAAKRPTETDRDPFARCLG